MLKAIFSARNLLEPDSEYYRNVYDIIESAPMLMTKKYMQHGVTTCYQHCINVSYYNYRLCRFLKLDSRSAARAGLLHDLFLYDWHSCRTEDGTPACMRSKHGFTHPRRALENADRNFLLNCRERDIILKHMFPLTISPPKYKETVVIIFVDKYCGLMETLEGIAIRLHILRKMSSSSKHMAI